LSGQCDAIVATAAFEPSVDKPDVRFVFHYGLSGSFETYYRAMGHAGRDGKQARALLFYDVQTDPFESGRLVPDTMREYAEFTGCRREFLLRHFGEAAPGGCENCDRCQSVKLGKAQHVRTQAG